MVRTAVTALSRDGPCGAGEDTGADVGAANTCERIGRTRTRAAPPAHEAERLPSAPLGLCVRRQGAARRVRPFVLL